MNDTRSRRISPRTGVGSAPAPSLIAGASVSRSSTRRVDAIARWYWSKTSPSVVRGHSSRWVMKMRVEYTPTSMRPSSAWNAPSTRMAVKLNKIAIRISGMNAEDGRIARSLAST